MESWYRSDILCARMEALVKRGLLRARTQANEWIVPDDEEVPMPPDGYIVSFMLFPDRGLVVPPHRFFRGLLHYYDIKLQHLAHHCLRLVVRGVFGGRAPL
jgi:hypothetical protein